MAVDLLKDKINKMFEEVLKCHKGKKSFTIMPAATLTGTIQKWFLLLCGKISVYSHLSLCCYQSFW